MKLSDILTLTQAERDRLMTHVESIDGWPAGFGVWGSRISHAEKGSVVTLSAEDMGSAFPVLERLYADAGLPLPEPAPEQDVASN